MRIIAGRWRGRRLPVPDLPGLRPTPDRTRETLFNWLAPRLAGARCLDLFAGSGALGFEALSRGAGAVCMVEREPRVVRQLRANAATLQADQLDIRQADALALLEQGPGDDGFDLVFLDPPFRQGLLAACCERLEAGGWLRDRARIYLESERETALPDLPPNWTIGREAQAGQVAYCLATREPA